MAFVHTGTPFNHNWHDPPCSNFDQLHSLESSQFDFDVDESICNGRYYNDDDCDLLSLSLEGLDSSQPTEHESERWRHEQKHVQPQQPRPELAVHPDPMLLECSWTSDDATRWPACTAFVDDPMAVDEQSYVSCAECKMRFDSYQQLEKHGKITAHLPFECTDKTCGKRLPRRDTMQRHVASHGEPQFSCKWCKERGISRSFVRKDRYKSHESKCAYRPHISILSHRPSNASMRGESRRGSATSTASSRSLSVNDMKRKILDMRSVLTANDANDLQALHRKLDTMDEKSVHDMYSNLAQTVLVKTSSAELRKYDRWGSTREL